MKIMKKILLSLTALVLGCAYSAADTRQVVLLLHQGTGTEYAYDQLQQALDDATAGDTLYLNDGDYPINGDALTISHPVSIIGMGINTRLLGTVDISIPDSVTLTSYMLDALRVNGNVRVQQPVNGLKYRKCTINGSIIWNATTRDLLIDRCNITTFNSTPLLKSGNVVNSRIYDEIVPTPNESNYGNSVNFLNCATAHIIMGNYDYGPNNYSSYTNCIVYNLCRGSHNSNWRVDEGISNSVFINSLLCIPLSSEGYQLYTFGKATQINCYTEDPSTFADWGYVSGCKFSQEEMIEKGWLGNDGTVIGPEGGSAPYTLIPSGISVRESKLTIDGENRMLNVRLKLTSN